MKKLCLPTEKRNFLILSYVLRIASDVSSISIKFVFISKSNKFGC